MVIRRGTTPNITATIPATVDLSSVTSVWLSFQQNSMVVLDKTIEDIIKGTNTITVPLTQQDTLSLKAGVMAYIQIRLLTDTDIAYASQMEYVSVEGIIKDGVIV